MENPLTIIGNESSVLFYNLNKQFVNIRKLVLSGEILFSALPQSFENLKQSLQSKKIEKEEFETLLNSTFEELEFDDSFYKKIQEELQRLSSDIGDVQLKNYNFMSSVSNAKYNVVLRTPLVSFTSHYCEKSGVLFAIKNLLKNYISHYYNGGAFAAFDKIQIEMYESEEIYKQVFLKKEGNNLLLYASYGFPQKVPFNVIIGGEFYLSEGEDFNFFKNKQEHIILRENNQLVEHELKEQEKILSNEDLIAINKETKTISDAFIELYITKKGYIRINSIGLLENSLTKKQESGIIINKSSKQYNKIAITTLRDNTEDTTNPKYLLLRTEPEVKEFLDSLSLAKHIDGVIITINFYHPLLDSLGSVLDIDIIYYNKPLKKTLEATVNFDQLEINAPEISENDTFNPFSGIIETPTKEKDELLEKFKNVDLSTPTQNTQEREQVSHMAQNIISSPQSQKPTSSLFSGSSSNGEKKTAMQLLADAALNPKPEEDHLEQVPQTPEPQAQQPSALGDFFMPEVSKEDLENTQELGVSVPNQASISSSHENVLATQILTTPQVRSGNYFLDSTTLTLAPEGNKYYVTTNLSEIESPSYKAVLPASLKQDSLKNKVHYILNNLGDFFILSKEDVVNTVFVNLSHIEDSIKESFLKSSLDKFRTVSVVIMKQDMLRLKEYISKIDSIFIKDLNNEEEYARAKESILSFEKQHMMRR